MRQILGIGAGLVFGFCVGFFTISSLVGTACAGDATLTLTSLEDKGTDRRVSSWSLRLRLRLRRGLRRGILLLVQIAVSLELLFPIDGWDR